LICIRIDLARAKGAGSGSRFRQVPPRHFEFRQRKTPKEKTLLAFLIWRGEMRTRQSKAIFAGGKGFALPRLFFKTAGIWYPPRRRVREECAADSLLVLLDLSGKICEYIVMSKK